MNSRSRIVTAVVIPRLPRSQQPPECPQSTTVRRVLSDEIDDDGTVLYKTLFEDGHDEILGHDQMLRLIGGRDALETFERQPHEIDEEDYEEDDQESDLDNTNGSDLIQSGDTDSEEDLHPSRRISLRAGGRGTRGKRNGLLPSRARGFQAVNKSTGYRTSARTTRAADRRKTVANPDSDLDIDDVDDVDHSEDDDSEDMDVFRSDVVSSRKRKRASRGRPPGRRLLEHQSLRQSGRSTRTRASMKEAEVGDVYRSDSSEEDEVRPTAKTVSVKEIFQELSRSDPFRLRHVQQCETCGSFGDGPRGQLIFCQGCSLSYHTTCMGVRSTRDHLVTKIDDREFVLQCRRCISVARRKEPTAPDQGLCQSCRQPGKASRPFRERKTTAQEERAREENDGIDPITPVDKSRINNADNVLFRCVTCWRAWHLHHLPSRIDIPDTGADDDLVADARFREFSSSWQCLDCQNMDAERTKIGELVAWRPVDVERYDPTDTAADIDEDVKEYLVKWEKRSYFQVQWLPGAWVWGVAAAAMRRAFIRRNNGSNYPTMTTEDAIPEDYLRIDIVLSVKFTSIVTTQAEEVDKARVREVDTALIKYKGLGYEDAVWEKVPTPEDGERWNDFVRAYEDWVMGRYVRQPKPAPLKNRVDKARATKFEELEKKEQPEMMRHNDKKLMKYQMDGVNWLYYNWYKKHNAILADEMGLGKTIQIIGLLATLVESHNCFPFLIVVPNSTCPNWRREIKEWAPSLRAIAYYGSSAARMMAYNFELFPEGAKDLRAHVVITSYDAAADESSRKFFKSVAWQGLIVDEGQRLKSDTTLLYDALSSLKIGFRVLLTGTPLQNNARELFNLLQFLDDTFDASALELEYAELTRANVPQLHSLIRPFFLRRTKAQVLTFLPSMAQIILPVSMSLVQRKLYFSIVAKNPDLVKAIFDKSRQIKSNERANLRNILMQLRKCLCHPFVYSGEIEDRSVDVAHSHRNLVDASSKLQLLEILLPKLKERGHRVLIFSQFLDMLSIVEDFLDGLSLDYQRLDGTISALEKQKRIDAFNAPDSPLFAFLLSTRAGGVGINLATADTVIIMDPDFNPHQDIQALSRAHRIGQKNKVLCFQLMTRLSAEEKIMQVGRRKMALDHVLIEKMDDDDEEELDVESILRHGIADLMDESIPDIKYDDNSVDKLLDRSQIEETRSAEDQTAESQFSFARVWANDNESLADSLESDDEDKEPDQNGWDRILQERQRQAAEEEERRQNTFGRGKRARMAVGYAEEMEHRRKQQSDSDTDFQAQDSGDDAEDEHGAESVNIAEEVRGLAPAATGAGERPVSGLAKVTHPPPWANANVKGFRRANVVWPDASQQAAWTRSMPRCIACGTWHEAGYCPFKLAGAEHCNLCGLAHYGVARTCPHIRSETQVRAMIDALKYSTEPREHVELAGKYLKGVKGTLIQQKKIKARRAEEARMREVGVPVSSTTGASAAPGTFGGSGGAATQAPKGTKDVVPSRQQQNHRPYTGGAGAPSRWPHQAQPPPPAGAAFQQRAPANMPTGVAGQSHSQFQSQAQAQATPRPQWQASNAGPQ